MRIYILIKHIEPLIKGFEAPILFIDGNVLSMNNDNGEQPIETLCQRKTRGEIPLT